MQKKKKEKSFSDLTLFLARLDSTRLGWNCMDCASHEGTYLLEHEKKIKGEGEGEGLAGAG